MSHPARLAILGDMTGPTDRNDSTPRDDSASAGSNNTTGTTQSKRYGFDDIESNLRRMWNTRPMRPRQGRKVAGVAEALGRRYAIDPVLLRVGFAVATLFGGAGLLAYLLLWVALQNEPDSNGDRSTTSTLLLIGVAVLTVPAVISVFSFGGLLSLTAIGIGLYLLDQHRGNHGLRNGGQVRAGQVQNTTNTPASEAPTQPNTAEAASADADTATSTPPPAQTPPAWDPLGAAPFAWDLPEPSEPTEQPEAKKEPRHPAITLVTLGLALLAGGLCTALGLDLPRTLAVSLAVVGVGMITGSFLRRGRGLLAAAIPLAVIALMLNALPDQGWRGAGHIKPELHSARDVQGSYSLSAGNIELDLRDLRLQDEQPLTTSASVGLGNITVLVPPNMDVEATCSARFGHVDCLKAEAGGPHSTQHARDAGSAGGGKVNLNLKAGTGNVEVFRG